MLENLCRRVLLSNIVCEQDEEAWRNVAKGSYTLTGLATNRTFSNPRTLPIDAETKVNKYENSMKMGSRGAYYVAPRGPNSVSDDDGGCGSMRGDFFFSALFFSSSKISTTMMPVKNKHIASVIPAILKRFPRVNSLVLGAAIAHKTRHRHGRIQGNRNKMLK